MSKAARINTDGLLIRLTIVRELAMNYSVLSPGLTHCTTFLYTVYHYAITKSGER